LANSLYTHPIHLGRGGTAVPQPEFDGVEWYEAYAARTDGDGEDGRLVGLHRFEGSWDSWEMHPVGAEVVLCLEGRMTLHQEHADGSTDVVTLGPGEYAINPPGTWHTADIEGRALGLFITSGSGTEHRPR
jgi:quercetin dioxygenase-like cupin family protein